jgi:hypothetical protein
MDIKSLLKKRWLRIAGTVLGLLGGYLYYHFIGCNSGTCPITSNPWVSTLYGGLIGFLLSDIVKPKSKKENNTTEKEA